MGRAVLILLIVAGCGGSGDKAASPAAQTAGGDPRAAIFVQKGCPQCHSISALGVKSPTEVGPDLTEAYEDVQLRFGVQLGQFLAQPTGTMQVVLSSHITLSPAERDSIVSILRAVWRAHEARQGHDIR